MPGDMVSPVSTISRQQDDGDRQVAHFLQRVVALRFLTLGEAQAGMVGDLLPQVARGELGARGQQVAPQVAAQQAVCQVDRTVDDEAPGEEEMPAAAGCKVLHGRQRRPGGEGRSAACPSTLETPSTPVAGITMPPARTTPRSCPPSWLEPMLRKDWSLGAGLAPVQIGPGIEDLQSAQQQETEADSIDPVRQARDEGMPGNQHGPFGFKFMAAP
jgi:hypothetical protein